MKNNNKLIHEQTTKFISKFNGKYFITLQFSRDIDKEYAERNLKIFLLKMNKKIFGKRSKKKWKQISAIEKDFSNNSYHIHIIAEDPLPRMPNQNRKLNFDLKSVVKETWRESGNSTNFRSLINSSAYKKWFVPIYDMRGVSSYICKQILNGRVDVIQWHLAEI